MSSKTLLLNDIEQMRIDARVNRPREGELDTLWERIETGRRKIADAESRGVGGRKIRDAKLKLAELEDEFYSGWRAEVRWYLFDHLYTIGDDLANRLKPGIPRGQVLALRLDLPGVLDEMTVELCHDIDTIPF